MKRYLILLIAGITCISGQVSVSSTSKLQSLILPGWGEQTLGESKRARSFFIREAALWLFYVGNVKAEKWYESDYTSFAELHADVEMSQKSSLYAKVSAVLAPYINLPCLLLLQTKGTRRECIKPILLCDKNLNDDGDSCMAVVLVSLWMDY